MKDPGQLTFETYALHLGEHEERLAWIWKGKPERYKAAWAAAEKAVVDNLASEIADCMTGKRRSEPCPACGRPLETFRGKDRCRTCGYHVHCCEGIPQP